MSLDLVPDGSLDDATATLPRRGPANGRRRDRQRHYRRRHYVMCAPRHFDVRYAINPWMDASRGADAERAMSQWDTLRRTYLSLGHRVDLIEPDPELPDMVFAANGALVIDGRVFGASFAHPQRRAEADRHRAHFATAHAAEVVAALHTNEGEGDFLVVGDVILAGSGFRTDPRAHREVEKFFGRRVISLELTDPRFYHLDTAVAVLDADTIAYYPGAFAADSVRVLERYFPGAVQAGEADALVLGLNAVSDGRHVIMAPGTTRLVGDLRDRGFDPIEIDLSELLKAGGSVKCCTMELHP